MTPRIPLSDEDRARYEWQLWVPEFGESGQEKLKNSTVLVSRLGGLGGVVAYELAAAGIGRLILAHAGNVKPSDLNRQLLMTTDWLGKPRIESAKRRLLELNPSLEIVAITENMNAENADDLVAQADLVVDCAPLFEERYAMNSAALRHNKPLIECAMYDMEFHLFTVLPGETPCVRCLFPKTTTRMASRIPRLRCGLRDGCLPGGRGGDQASRRARHAARRTNAHRGSSQSGIPSGCSQSSGRLQRMRCCELSARRYNVEDSTDITPGHRRARVLG